MANPLPVQQPIGLAPTTRDFTMFQTRWKALLGPILSNPANQGLLLQNVKLINGVTVVNHLLGREMQGWIIADIDGAATIYRSAKMNDLTLTLTSNAAVTVSLEVF